MFPILPLILVLIGAGLAELARGEAQRIGPKTAEPARIVALRAIGTADDAMSRQAQAERVGGRLVGQLQRPVGRVARLGEQLAGACGIVRHRVERRLTGPVIRRQQRLRRTGGVPEQVRDQGLAVDGMSDGTTHRPATERRVGSASSPSADR